MRRRLIYLAPLLLALATGCMKSNDQESTPIAVPEGNFTGQFKAIKKKATGGGYDTLKTTFLMNISKATGFRVKGDTTVLHAGGNGNFAMDANYIQFADSVYAGNGLKPKYHLIGVYRYAYDGTNFQFYRTSSDTLALVYDLKKN
jgi:hypothetical protein